MTTAPGEQASTELEDGVGDRGHPGHILAENRFCEARQYRLLRTAGWVYAAPQPGTQSLCICCSGSERSHFASNNPRCDYVSQVEELLGYQRKE